MLLIEPPSRQVPHGRDSSWNNDRGAGLPDRERNAGPNRIAGQSHVNGGLAIQHAASGPPHLIQQEPTPISDHVHIVQSVGCHNRGVSIVDEFDVSQSAVRHRTLLIAAKSPPRGDCDKTRPLAPQNAKHGYLVDKSTSCAIHQHNTATGIIIINRSRANEPSQPRNSNSSYVFMFASGGACCSRANQYRVPFAEPQESTELSFQTQKSRKKTSCSAISAESYGQSRSRSIANWQGLQALPTGLRANGCAAASIRRQASSSPSWWRSQEGIDSCWIGLGSFAATAGHHENGSIGVVSKTRYAPRLGRAWIGALTQAMQFSSCEKQTHRNSSAGCGCKSAIGFSRAKSTNNESGVGPDAGNRSQSHLQAVTAGETAPISLANAQRSKARNRNRPNRAAEGMKHCASRLAAGRTAVARGPVSVAAARTNSFAVRASLCTHSQLPGRVPTQEQHARVLCFCFPSSKRKAGRRDNPCPHAIALQQGLATPNTNSTDTISSRRPRDVGNVAKSERGPIGHRASHLLEHNFKGVSVTLTPPTNPGAGTSGPLIRCGEGGRAVTRAWARAGISLERGAAWWQ